MDLSTIWYAVSDQFQQLAPARRPLKPYMFNIVLQYVDMDIRRKALRMIANPSEDVTGNEEQMDILQKFKKSSSISPCAAQSLPSGYMRFIAAYDENDNEIHLVDVDTYTKWKSNEVLNPSSDNPVLYISEGMIRFDPTNTFTTTFWYYGDLVGAEKPNLVLKAEDSINVYDEENSVELVWPDHMYPKITAEMIKYLELSINNPNLFQEKMKELDNVTT